MAVVKSRGLGQGAGAIKGVVVVTISLGENAAMLDTHAFVADQPYRVVEVREVHAVAGTDAGAVTLMPRKTTGTQAPSAGVALLTGTFNLKGAVNTVLTGTLVAADADLELAVNDRISLDFTGVVTALAGLNVSLVLLPLPDKKYFVVSPV